MSDANGKSAAREQKEWILPELASILGLDHEDEDTLDALTSKLQFWLQRGVLRMVPWLKSQLYLTRMLNGGDTAVDEDASRMVYQLVEFRDHTVDDDDEDAGGAADSASFGTGLNERQQAEQEQQVESYALGALGNFARYARGEECDGRRRAVCHACFVAMVHSFFTFTLVLCRSFSSLPTRVLSTRSASPSTSCTR
jgi:hypothetical protein